MTVTQVVISNAAANLVQKETGQFDFGVTLSPAICPYLWLPCYAEIDITHSIEDGQAPMIMRMQEGLNGDLWIREDGPHHH